jgi:hypothetical protein
MLLTLTLPLEAVATARPASARLRRVESFMVKVKRMEVGPGVVGLSVSVVDFGRSRGRVGREEGVEGVEGVCLFTSETSR